MPLMAEGEFTLVQQHLRTALERFDRGLDFSTTTPSADVDLYVMLVDAAAQQRDLTTLQQYTPRAEELAERCDHPLYQAICHRAQGVAHCLAGDFTEAAARLDHALALFEELETRWQIGRTLAEQGELALACDDYAAASQHFARAAELFEAQEAMPDAARMRKRLQSLQ